MTMRPFRMRPSFLLPCLLGLAALPALAQVRTPPATDVPPPQMEKLEEGEQPAITIRKPGGEAEITQKREQGRVTEVKVKRGNNEYYAKPNVPAGSALPGDVQSNDTRPAQWKVGEFGKVPPQPVEPEQTLQPNPAAAPAAPAAPAGKAGSK